MRSVCILLLFLGALFLLNCQTYFHWKKPKAKSAPISAKKALEQIKKTARKKPFPQTKKELETFIKSNKKNALAFDGYLFMAQIYKKKGQPSLACQAYQKALQLPFFHHLQTEAVFSLARCFIKQKKPKEAWKLLESHIQKQDYTFPIKYKAALLQWNLIRIKKGKQAQDWKLKTLSLLIVTAQKEKEKSRWKKVAGKFFK